jgi:hypothetical protein
MCQSLATHNPNQKPTSSPVFQFTKEFKKGEMQCRLEDVCIFEDGFLGLWKMPSLLSLSHSVIQNQCHQKGEGLGTTSWHSTPVVLGLFPHAVQALWDAFWPF